MVHLYSDIQSPPCAASNTDKGASPIEMDDRALAAAIAADPDNTALSEELIRRYMPLVKSTAAKFSTDSFQREDLESEGCLAIFRAAEMFNENKCSSFSAYMSVCVRNRLTSVMRRFRDPDLSADDDLSEPSDNITPETIFLQRELGTEIRRQLSPLEYSIFRCCMEELTYSEIAEQLKISAKSVDNAVQRIRRKLKKIYGDELSIWPQ